MRVTPAARLLAIGRGNTPSPFKIATSPRIRIHSFMRYQVRLSFLRRQYARGPSLEDSGSMLDSVSVTEITAPIAESPRPSTAAKVGWAILIVATLYVCCFSHLGAIGFVGQTNRATPGSRATG